MSLEDAIKALTEAVERNTAAINTVLSQAAGGEAAGTEEKKPRGRKPKAEDKPEDKAEPEEKAEEAAEEKPEPKVEPKPAAEDVDFGDLRKRLTQWLGEFSKEEDRDNPDGAHPEAKARKDAIKTAIKKLGGEKLTDIGNNQESVNRLAKWLDKKLVEDNGHGVGRLAADPVAAAADEDDDI